MKKITKAIFLIMCACLMLASCNASPTNPIATNPIATNSIAIQQIAISDDISLKLFEDGTLYAFERNNNEGQGEVALFAGTKFKQIDGMKQSLAAIDEEGTLYFWENGLFTGINVNKLTAESLISSVTYPLDKKVKDVSLGYNYILALAEDGLIWSWGQEHGQLGNDRYREAALEPTAIIDYMHGEENITFASVSAGPIGATALRSDGIFYEWGDFGEPISEYTERNIIRGGPPSHVKEIGATIQTEDGFIFNLLLTKDGRVLGKGRNDYGQSNPDGEIYTEKHSEITLPEPIKNIKAGESYGLALGESGSVYAWGNNAFGQLGLPPSSMEPPTKLDFDEEIVSIEVGENSSVFISKSGTIYVSGYHCDSLFYGEDKENPVKVLYLFTDEEIPSSKFTHIISGYGVDAAIDEQNRVYTWGEGYWSRGSLGIKSMTDIQEPRLLKGLGKNCIDLKNASGTVALLENGEIYTWGWNGMYNLGLGHALQMWEPQKISLPEPVNRIFIGTGATIAELKNGDWYTWGDNTFGCLLTGDAEIYKEPVKIDIPYSVQTITNSACFSVILDTDGSLYQFGEIQSGGRMYVKSSFVKVPISEKMIDVQSYYFGAFALSEEGNVYAWGVNRDGRLGLKEEKIYDKPTLVNVGEKISQIAVAQNYGAIFALTASGKVYTWGYNILAYTEDTFLDTPIEVNLPEKIYKVIMGDLTAYAIAESGNIYTWGGYTNTDKDTARTTPTLLPYKFVVK